MREGGLDYSSGSQFHRLETGNIALGAGAGRRRSTKILFGKDLLSKVLTS